MSGRSVEVVGIWLLAIVITFDTFIGIAAQGAALGVSVLLVRSLRRS